MLNQCVDYIDGNHDFVAKFIAANIPSIKYVKPEGTYLAWLDVTAVADRIKLESACAEHTHQAGQRSSLTPEQMVERYFVKTPGPHEPGRV